MTKTIYLKAAASCRVERPEVVLSDVVGIHCRDPKVLMHLKALSLYRFREEKEAVFSILKVIGLIEKEYPDATIVNCGEEDFLVEYVCSPKQNPLLERVKLLLVGILVFFGAAFTIMAFHNDIGIEGVFETFYFQVMGSKKPPVTELEIAYSIGLGVGIVVFFNHFGRKQISKDPTPIEVEMKKYNKDVQNAKIANAEEKGRVKDV